MMLFNTRIHVSLVTGLGLASAFALWACSTETTVISKTHADDDAGVPTDDAGGDPGSTPDAGPPADRTVKGTWEKIAVHPADGDPIESFSGIFVRGPSDVYVSEGSSNLGTGFYHFDGTAWTGVRYPGYGASLAGLPSGDVLGFGGDLFIKAKTGDAWQSFPQPQGTGAPSLILSLWGSSTSNLYASTGDGNVRFNGSGWVPIAGLDQEGAFAGVSAKDVWFSSNGVSSHGKSQLMHYDGTTWTSQWSSVPADVQKLPTDGPYGVFASGPDDVWAMGRRRTMIHYDGSAWKDVSGPNDEWGCDLTRGWASSKKNAWLVGKGGCVFHWDGALWEKIPSGVTDDIYAIHGTDPEHVWIAPYNTKNVLRLKPE